MLGKDFFSETDKENYNSSLPNDRDTIVIPVIHETVSIDKQVVEKGKIKVKKTVEEVNEAIDVTLQHDEYTIKRVAINEYVDAHAPQVRYEGNTLIIPVVKEVVVKRLLLVEEVHIVKEIVAANEQLNIPLRKETVVVSRSANDDTSTSISS